MAATGPARQSTTAATGPARQSTTAATGPARQSTTVPSPARLLPIALAATVVLYATQTLYSPDFSKSLQNLCFFLIPFALLFTLLRAQRWDARLLRLTFAVVAASALAFALVGLFEFATGSLFWNDQVIRSNEFHTYFRVNSVFWDPNIYGRYLALAIVLLTAALLWARERRALALLTALIAVLWVGLLPSFSQSSFAALLAGLAALAAIRWSMRWTVAAVACGAALAVIAVLFIGGNSTISLNRVNVDTAGRANLIEGGTRLFAQRPLWGHGAGSFPRAYRERIATKKAPVAESHTEPITVAAEQGLIGLITYFSLLLIAVWTMASGLKPPRPSFEPASRAGGVDIGVPSRVSEGSPMAATGPARQSTTAATGPARQSTTAATGPARQSTTVNIVARTAVLAAFAALVVHTLAYAGFYEDPITWTLLAAATALATTPIRPEP